MIFDKNGGRSGGARLLAVVTLKTGEAGRHYRLATNCDYEAVRKADRRLVKLLVTWEKAGRKGQCPVPDEPTPAGGGSGAGRAFSVQKYGMMRWDDLFSARQKLALKDLCDNIGDSTLELPAAAKRLAALAIGKPADLGNAGTPWKRDAECPQ